MRLFGKFHASWFLYEFVPWDKLDLLFHNNNRCLNPVKNDGTTSSVSSEDRSTRSYLTSIGARMESLFVRSLALPTAQQAQCVTNASRTTADGTFAVASAAEGVIRVYAASCGALLHEFASIHKRIYALHYTSFSDSLVTLESDVLPRTTSDNIDTDDNYSNNEDEYDDDDDNVETFLCVYHDWRERKMVRGYTLPLGVLESPASRRKADCVAVCSFTGRVVVAMGSVLNLWQCSRGFFEHVLELKVDMAQAHAFLQVEFVAIHGVYVAFASQTEVRVMEIHVRSSSSSKENESSSPTTALKLPVPSALPPPSHVDAPLVPPDEGDCVSIATLDDLHAFVDVPIPCPSYCDADAPDPRDEQRLFDELDEPAQPLVLDRNEAQQEAWNLAGLVKSQDVRVNRALAYAVGERDVHVLLQRFLPPHHSVRSLAFLPETIDNQVSVEARSYTRLLVATERTAFLYYFLSREADATRRHMARKVFGSDDHTQRQLHRTKSRGMHKPIHVRRSDDDDESESDDTETLDDASATDDDEDATAASGRVVMFYQFSSPVSCIAANSSFLFVATLAGLQVWSIWSPCHYVAASRALSKALVPQPTQPQLLCTQPTPFPAAQIAALDSYVVLLPARRSTAATTPFDFIRLGSIAAADRLPDDEFELRRSSRRSRKTPRSVLVFQQSPPSLIFAYMRNAILATERHDRAIHTSQIDLLLSLFSLYRYRADVGLDQLHVQRTAATPADHADAKETLALELETKLYDAIAKACAADLAAIFTSETHRNLSRAARLYVASNVSSSDVLQRFEAIASAENRADVIDATSQYLEAFVFPSTEALPTTTATAATDASTERHFTRTVLLHYGTYAPEQLSRLIIDATLAWSLEDIAFGLAKLTESTSQSALVRIATLVLVLRASSASLDAWAALAGDTQQHEAFVAMCAYDTMATRVQELLRDHRDALVHVSVTHPELLVRVVETPSGATRFTTSAFARALRECAPRVLLQVLERVFTRAVRRQEAVLASLLFCLSVVGDAAHASIDRMTQRQVADAAPAFETDACFVLRLLVFVLEMFPTLEQLVDREELHENEDELRRVRAAIGSELVALCVALSSFVQAHSADARSEVLTTLCELFRRSDSEPHDEDDDSVGAALPAWVHEYLDVRCLPTVTESPTSTELRRRLRFLFALTLELVQERDLVAPTEFLQRFEAPPESKKARKTTPSAWRLENDFAALVVLLTLPRVARCVRSSRSLCLSVSADRLTSSPSCAGRWTRSSSLLRARTLRTSSCRTPSATARRSRNGAASSRRSLRSPRARPRYRHTRC